ncbi:ribonuclease P protein component [Nocardioides aromaticivorans]|uniref:Ribonuclease P protein component n=1 Tax=Nocardioides aromaticivorans TaxID=200618 RepID=A0ABX7PT55_9ACTN|nr:ribonuclease P protein component [Nocardioides aromaticivorans]QSR28875.1 ribonuclease P protein component [Nocardioides aromaticivorans]
MLAAGNRLTDPEGFRAASRRGHRAGARTVVTHLLLPPGQQVVGMSGTSSSAGPTLPAARVGFVVSKAVGNAVVRNRTKRRLRHAVRERLAVLPPGSLLVVRAQPAAALASYTELVADLERCLQRVTERVVQPGEAR